MVDTDQNLMVVKDDSVTWQAPDGSNFAIFYDGSGLPTRAVENGSVILYDNWTSTTVDIAIISPDGSYSVFRELSVDPSQISALGWPLRSAFETHNFTNQNLATVLRWGSRLVSAGLCGFAIGGAIASAGATFPAAAWACASTVITIGVILTSGDNTALEATGETLSQFGFALCTGVLDCAAALAGIGATILGEAESTLSDQNTSVAQAENELGTITDDLLPDLAVTELTVSPTSLYPADPVSLSATVQNVGVDVAGEFDMKFYYSEDVDITGADMLLGLECHFNSLSVGGIVFCYGAGTIPSSAITGPGHVGVIADENNTVVEEIETNNTSATEIAIVGRADVTITVSAPSTAAITSEITITATVTTIGEVAAEDPLGGVPVSFSLSQDNIFDDEDYSIGGCTIFGGVAPGTSESCSDTEDWHQYFIAGPGTYFIIGRVPNRGLYFRESDYDNNTGYSEISFE